MKKNISAIRVALIFGIILFCLDLAFKWYCNSYRPSLNIAGLGVSRHLSPGLVAEFFGESIAPRYRLIFLSTLYSFLNILIGMTLYFKARYHAPYYLTGLSLSLFGFTSNLIDRLRFGQVMDYLSFNDSFHFSIADISITGGILLTLYGLIHKDRFNLFWQGKLRKKIYLIDKRFQLKVAVLHSLFTFIIFSVYFAFTYTFIQPIMKNSHLRSVFLLGSLSALIITTSLVFIFNVFISHRTAGPLWKLKQWLNSVIKGDHFPYRLRDGDYHKDLEEITDELYEMIKKERGDMNELPAIPNSLIDKKDDAA